MYTGFAEKFSKPISRPPPPAPLPPPPPSLPTPRTITTSDPESARERAGSGTRPGRQYSSNSCLRRTRLAWSCHHSLLPGFLQSPGPQAGASCRLLGVDGEEGGELHTPPRLRAGEGGRSPPKPLGWSARPKRVEVGDSEPRRSDPPTPHPLTGGGSFSAPLPHLAQRARTQRAHRGAGHLPPPVPGPAQPSSPSSVAWKGRHPGRGGPEGDRAPRSGGAHLRAGSLRRPVRPPAAPSPLLEEVAAARPLASKRRLLAPRRRRSSLPSSLRVSLPPSPQVLPPSLCPPEPELSSPPLSRRPAQRRAALRPPPAHPRPGPAGGCGPRASGCRAPVPVEGGREGFRLDRALPPFSALPRPEAAARTHPAAKGVGTEGSALALPVSLHSP